ncbi:MAG: hypothetical protein ACC645_26920 [Pirellulales bacterium]
MNGMGRLVVDSGLLVVVWIIPIGHVPTHEIHVDTPADIRTAWRSALAGQGAILTDNRTDYFVTPRPAGPQDVGPVNANATQTTKWRDRRSEL